jgi:hypothetical protein
MIDRTVPVSRADYDQMADQRDAFRAALETAETYFEDVLLRLADARTSVAELADADGPDVRDDAAADVRDAMWYAEECAKHGLAAVKKALQSAR